MGGEIRDSLSRFLGKVLKEASSSTLEEALVDDCDPRRGPRHRQVVLVKPSGRNGAHSVVVRANPDGFSLWAVSGAGEGKEEIGWLDWDAVDLLNRARAAVAPINLLGDPT